MTKEQQRHPKTTHYAIEIVTLGRILWGTVGDDPESVIQKYAADSGVPDWHVRDDPELRIVEVQATPLTCRQVADVIAREESEGEAS